MIRRRSPSIGRLLAGAAVIACLTGLGGVRPADASIVERIVAVVGERPILLSELRSRGRPHLWRIAASIPMALAIAHADGRLARGMRVALLGTGAGLSVGAMILRF